MFLNKSVSLWALLFAFQAYSENRMLCNLYSELCDRPFNDIVYVTTHNSYAVGLSPAANQRNSIIVQLHDGVRALNLDAHKLDPNSHKYGDIQLCHTSCALLNAGTMVDTLKDINKWLDTHPNEVLTVFIENSDNFPLAEFTPSFQNSGILSKVYYRSDFVSPWPTLRQMILSGQRVVVMTVGRDASVPWLMNEWDFMWESPYLVPFSSPFPCNKDRPEGPLSVPDSMAMSVISHFVFTTFVISGTAIPTPNPTVATQVNGKDLESHMNTCKEMKVKVNFIMVDFYEFGSVFQIAANLNGVKYTGKPTTSDLSQKRMINNIVWMTIGILVVILL